MSKRGLVFALAMMLLAGCKKASPPVESTVFPQNVAPENTISKSAAPETMKPSSLPLSKQSLPVQQKTATAEPQFGWDKYDDETFSIGPSQGRFFVVPKNATRLRVGISASTPVIAGVMDKADIKNKGVVNASHFTTLPCAFVKTASGDRQCSLDPKVLDVFVLRDNRVELTHPKTPKVADNKVKVTLLAWACVANCKPLVGDGK